MEIRLDSLDARDFTLELPARLEVPDRRLSLDQVVGLGGGLHTEPGLLRLSGARAESGVIARLAWPIGKARLTSEAPISLSAPRIDSTHATGGSDTPLVFDGSAAEILATALDITFPNLRATTDLKTTDPTLAIEGGETTVTAATARSDNLQFHTGELFLRAALSLAGLRFQTGSGFQLATSRGAADHLHIENGPLVVEATDVEVSGVAMKGGELRLEGTRISEITVTLRLPTPLPPATDEPSRDQAPPTRVTLRDDVIFYGERALLDLRDLDRFVGDAEVAVFVTAQLPVVGRYRLDRSFKIPIANGQINFVEVERQLGTIEDAFIDFAVRSGELILKRDIPLLPTKGKTLVRWPISEVEQGLADNRLIRLRALSRYEVQKAASGDKKATVAAVKVDIPRFEVSLPAASDERPDAWGVVPAEVHIRSIDKLSIGGGLLFNAAASSRELDARLRSEGLRLQIASWPFSGRHLFAQSLSCGELEIEVPEWNEFRPLAVTIRARDVTIERAGLRNPPPIAARTSDQRDAIEGAASDER